MTKRTRVVVAAGAAGALAVGGLVVKRVLHHGGGDGDGGTGASADPIAETPTAPPGAEEKAVPKPKPAKPKPPKAKADKPKADKPKPPKAKAEPKDKPAKPKDAKPPKPAGKGPHAELNNPVVDDPDLTEYPDPYDQRPDPRDPVDPDGAPFGEEPHPATGAGSTSEPPLQQDPEVENGGKPPRRDRLDD